MRTCASDGAEHLQHSAEQQAFLDTNAPKESLELQVTNKIKQFICLTPAHPGRDCRSAAERPGWQIAHRPGMSRPAGSAARAPHRPAQQQKMMEQLGLVSKEGRACKQRSKRTMPYCKPGPVCHTRLCERGREPHLSRQLPRNSTLHRHGQTACLRQARLQHQRSTRREVRQLQGLEPKGLPVVVDVWRRIRCVVVQACGWD